MKDVKEVVACVIDNGMFMPVAERLSRDMAKVYYHTPWDEGYPEIGECSLGDGAPGILRLDDFWEPKVFDEIDLFVIPNLIGEGMQKFLERSGKAVWGSRSGAQLERMKGKFYDTLKQVGLPVPKHVVKDGFTAACDYLKDHDDLYVKISKYRGTMDTWHHKSYEESSAYLDWLAVRMGPLREQVRFYLISPIETEIEGGIDNYCIDGQWPEYAVLGYEKKNKTYLATVKKLEDMPAEFTVVNEAIAPVLASFNYRNFFSTEIRVKGDKSYFIDPTCRCPSPAGEEELELFGNISDIIWRGAHGELVEPEIVAQFAGEALIVYQGEVDAWKQLKVPEEVRQWVKLYGCGELDGVALFPPNKEEVIGCAVGIGDTALEVIESLKDTIKAMAGLPVEIDISSMAGLLQEIEAAEEKGIEFTDKEMPDPTEVLNGE